MADLASTTYDETLIKFHGVRAKTNFPIPMGKMNWELS